MRNLLKIKAALQYKLCYICISFSAWTVLWSLRIADFVAFLKTRFKTTSVLVCQLRLLKNYVLNSEWSLASGYVLTKIIVPNSIVIMTVHCTFMTTDTELKNTE